MHPHGPLGDGLLTDLLIFEPMTDRIEAPLGPEEAEESPSFLFERDYYFTFRSRSAR